MILILPSVQDLDITVIVLLVIIMLLLLGEWGYLIKHDCQN